MSVQLRYEAKFHADETPSLALDLVSNPVIQHRISYSGGVSGTIDGDTTIAVDDAFSDRITLTAGAHTIDLSALTSTLGTTKNFTGKKVKGMILSANASNTGGVLVKRGASNGYPIFSTLAGEATVWPGLPFVQLFGNNLSAIGASTKTVDLSSADTDAELELVIVVGT